MNRCIRLCCSAAISTLLLAGCYSSRSGGYGHYPPHDDGYHGRSSRHDKPAAPYVKSRGKAKGKKPGKLKGSKKLGIPPGQLPPPGQCRIWYPGRPPGKQPPPGPCHDLRGKLPPGAWLLTHQGARHGEIRVLECHTHKVGIIVRVRIYNIETGIYVGGYIP